MPTALESWPAVADGLHNSNTDLIYWRGEFWLAHAAAPWHFRSTRTRIVIRRSPDARAWTETASFSVPGEDVGDPKLAVIGDKLFLCFLPNRHFPEPQPYTTLVTASNDGAAWEAPAPVEPSGWLLWRPKKLGDELVVTAYWHEHGRAALLRSSDGRRWRTAGDTSYAGVVVHDGSVYASYYASRVDRDYPWLVGMLAPSEIRIARLPLDALARLDGAP